jgi:hypothetical protein
MNIAVTYEATAPDGTIHTMRSIDPKAYVTFSQDSVGWFVWRWTGTLEHAMRDVFVARKRGFSDLRIREVREVAAEKTA